MTATQEPFEQWAIVELTGHRRLAGLVAGVFAILAVYKKEMREASEGSVSPSLLICH